jgi:prepilin-type N-terminal cleavage/methylation domain-containing protein
VLEHSGGHVRQLTQCGLTLIELIVTLLLMAMLFLLGAPMMSDYQRNAKLREAGSAVLSASLFARSEAIKRNEPLALAASGADLRVTAPNGEVLRHDVLNQGVTARIVRTSDDVELDTVIFGGAGRPSPFGSSFRIETALSGVPCTAENRCPRVMLRSGGGMRLCPQAEDC